MKEVAQMGKQATRDFYRATKEKSRNQKKRKREKKKKKRTEKRRKRKKVQKKRIKPGRENRCVCSGSDGQKSDPRLPSDHQGKVAKPKEKKEEEEEERKRNKTKQGGKIDAFVDV